MGLFGGETTNSPRRKKKITLNKAPFKGNSTPISSLYFTPSETTESMYKYTILLLSIFLGSCSNQEVQTTYPSGNIKEKFEVKNDSIKHGVYTSYSEDGTTSEIANFADGVLNGKRQLFYTNGSIEIEEIYKNGVMDGDYKVFYKNGTDKINSTFVNGVLQGVLYKFYDDGKLMEEVTFVDNEENGPFKEFHPNGQVQWEGSYLNGDSEFGLLIHYDEEGETIKKMMCDSLGVCQTIWTPEDGDIIPKNLKLSRS